MQPVKKRSIDNNTLEAAQHYKPFKPCTSQSSRYVAKSSSCIVDSTESSIIELASGHFGVACSSRQMITLLVLLVQGNLWVLQEALYLTQTHHISMHTHTRARFNHQIRINKHIISAYTSTHYHHAPAHHISISTHYQHTDAHARFNHQNSIHKHIISAYTSTP